MKPQNQISIKTRIDRVNHVARKTFTGNENHVITLEAATRLTENYRRSVPESSILGGIFGQETVEKLVRQQSCVGLRIYYASKDDSSPTFVLVGVNSNNSDLSLGLLGTSPIMSPASLALQITEDNSPYLRDDDPSSGTDQVCSGRENQLTTLADASRLTRNFRDSAQGTIIKGGFFAKNIFNKMLGQSGCVGIHIYYAQHDDGRQALVLAGVDRMGRHYAKWPFGDEAWLCPPFCAPSNSLNH